MKKAVLVLALLVMGATVASAENICTPITISVNPTTHDDGNGPAWNLGLGGSNFPFFYYQPGAVVNLIGTTYIWMHGNLPGYANVYAGFNGCQSDWWLAVEGEYIVYDNTLKQTLYDSQAFYYQIAYDCGKAISCPYSGSGTYSPYIPTVAGRQYIVSYKIWAITPFGDSPTYTRSITVNVTN